MKVSTDQSHLLDFAARRMWHHVNHYYLLEQGISELYLKVESTYRLVHDFVNASDSYTSTLMTFRQARRVPLYHMILNLRKLASIPGGRKLQTFHETF